jgi:hypothetical protein
MKIEDHPLVSFLPLDLTNSDSLETVVSHIDYTMQYGEDEEPKEVCFCLTFYYWVWKSPTPSPFVWLPLCLLSPDTAARLGRRRFCRFGVNLFCSPNAPALELFDLRKCRDTQRRCTLGRSIKLLVRLRANPFVSHPVLSHNPSWDKLP